MENIVNKSNSTDISNDVITLEDNDIITSTVRDINNKTKTVNSVDILTNAIGQNNLNVIIDALCTLNNMEIRSKALNALFSSKKEIVSRKTQTDVITNETSAISYGAFDSEIQMEDNHQNLPNCIMEVTIEQSEEYQQTESIITGEGELNVNHNQGNIKFVLKGDGRRHSIDTEE